MILYYIYIMAIVQTVNIPASRKLTVDVPPGVPVGRVVISYEPAGETPWGAPYGTRVLGCAKGQFWMADDFNVPMALVDDV